METIDREGRLRKYVCMLVLMQGHCWGELLQVSSVQCTYMCVAVVHSNNALIALSLWSTTYKCKARMHLDTVNWEIFVVKIFSYGLLAYEN